MSNLLEQVTKLAELQSKVAPAPWLLTTINTNSRGLGQYDQAIKSTSSGMLGGLPAPSVIMHLQFTAFGEASYASDGDITGYYPTQFTKDNAQFIADARAIDFGLLKHTLKWADDNAAALQALRLAAPAPSLVKETPAAEPVLGMPISEPLPKAAERLGWERLCRLALKKAAHFEARLAESESNLSAALNTLNLHNAAALRPQYQQERGGQDAGTDFANAISVAAKAHRDALFSSSKEQREGVPPFRISLERLAEIRKADEECDPKDGMLRDFSPAACHREELLLELDAIGKQLLAERRERARAESVLLAYQGGGSALSANCLLQLMLNGTINSAKKDELWELLTPSDRIAYHNYCEQVAATPTPVATAETGGGWVSVAERLPEFGERVLLLYGCALGKNRQTVGSFAHAGINGHAAEPDNVWVNEYEPTHWQPLPTAPAEKGATNG